jgi:6-pyruvoyltetrahydropterin/6-carboxytetrahydropterin synthase
MYRVSKEIWFCYGHRLLNYNGKCANLHGHNGKAVITVETASLDELGMVVDFSLMKQRIGKWIDDVLDHKMLLNVADPIIPELPRLGEPYVPCDFNPTAENLAKMIYDHAIEQGFPVVDVTLWETENSYASYNGPSKSKH